MKEVTKDYIDGKSVRVIACLLHVPFCCDCDLDKQEQPDRNYGSDEMSGGSRKDSLTFISLSTP